MHVNCEVIATCQFGRSDFISYHAVCNATSPACVRVFAFSCGNSCCARISTGKWLLKFAPVRTDVKLSQIEFCFVKADSLGLIHT